MSADRLSLILEQAIDGFWDWDIPNDMVYLSPGYCALIGRSPGNETISPDSFSPLIHPDDRERTSTALGEHLEGKRRDLVLEFRLICATGEYRWIESRGKIVERDRAGRPARMVGTIVDISRRKQEEEEFALPRDISERKRDEEELLASEERMRVMVEHLPAGAVYREGDRLFINRAAEEIIGFPRDAIATVDAWFRALYPENHATVRKYYEEDRAANFPFRRTVPLRRGDGSVRFVEFSGARHPRGDIWLMNDVTARKVAESEIQRLNTELELRVAERTSELEAFCYSVSHDLRAPLRHIAGYSEILQEECFDRLDDKCRQYLSRIARAAVRMGELVDGLLVLSLVSREELHREVVDLGAICREITAELAQREPQRQVEVAVAEEAETSGDPRLLHILLENLLGNAWKFTARKPEARIEFGTIGTGSNRAYFVRDNGAGFDMKFSGKLFGTFERLHADDDFPGTGIGLAIVQKIVRRHGGRIWAESQVGKGATFFFILGSESL